VNSWTLTCLNGPRQETSSAPDGIIRDHHFGEGRHEQPERVIRRGLGLERELVSVEERGVLMGALGFPP
jgi:hypothetical protein